MNLILLALSLILTLFSIYVAFWTNWDTTAQIIVNIHHEGVWLQGVLKSALPTTKYRLLVVGKIRAPSVFILIETLNIIRD
jgi:hypothetical protein